MIVAKATDNGIEDGALAIGAGAMGEVQGMLACGSSQCVAKETLQVRGEINVAADRA